MRPDVWTVLLGAVGESAQDVMQCFLALVVGGVVAASWTTLALLRGRRRRIRREARVEVAGVEAGQFLSRKAA